MDKRKLAKIPRALATAEMLELAGRLGGFRYIATAELIGDKKILLLTFYRISELQKGKPEAEFRTFLSDSDYITQDLKVSKVKWLTGAFAGMQNFSLLEYQWDSETRKSAYRENVFLMTDAEKCIISDFFKIYQNPNDEYGPWTWIHRFQEEVKEKRLSAKHKRETDKIDAVMNPIKDAPREFFDWVWEKGMSFSRYLIYKEETKGKAVCECTHCGKIGVVDRKDIRLRNNEKSICPFCGSRVTIKAKGRMPAQILDERWFLYVDPTQEGFVLRYFKAIRHIRNDSYIDTIINKSRVEQSVYEYSRAIYTFPKGEPKYVSYEWGVYKQRGLPRWCPDAGNVACMNCILYPGNLPQAWEHTPMKYSALEILASNAPTVSMRYEDGIKAFLKHPFLEWVIKMGLNKIAKGVMESKYGMETGKLNCNGETIYQILGLDKLNTRVLQQIDGSYDELRLLQVAQQIGLQLKPEQLRGYYEAFGCNTDLLKQSGRKVSLYKLVKYITKESENYPIGDTGRCWRYSYMQYKEREDPRIERKRNTAKDWLEYLGWCEEMKYDLNNMFIYMPTKFKKVHDRTAEEYQAYKDAEMRKRQERMEKKIKKVLEEAAGLPAVMMKAKGLTIIIPKSGEEIKEEGRILHHCVGTYVERVAKGETLILFVRKKAEPDTPYFTLEYRDGRVIQCRGRNNCGMPQDVKTFVQAFERKMQGKEEKKSGTERKVG